MRSALIHGVLLAVMLVYGYRTWTRDKTVEVKLGDVVLWDRAEGDLVSIELKCDDKCGATGTGPAKIVRLERRVEGGYWWGTETTIEKKPKPAAPKPPDPAPTPGEGSGSAGEGSGSAGEGSGAGSGSAAAPAEPAPVPEMEETRKVREFPIGDGGEEIVTAYTAARAMRDLGSPSEDNKKTYKLTESQTTLTVTFRTGERVFVLGGQVYGNQHRYALEPSTGKVYVLSKDLVSSLELGQSSLHLADPRGFDVTKIEGAVVEGGGKRKAGARVTTQVDGRAVKTWADAETKEANAALGNYVDLIGGLRPTEYVTMIDAATLSEVVKVTYLDKDGKPLGAVELYRREKPVDLPEGTELDPANPPKGELEYYLRTEKTVVLGLLAKDRGQQAEQNFADLFSDKPAGGVAPPGNPFGNVPLPLPGPAPGGGGVAPAPAPAPAPPAPAPAPPPPNPHAGHGH